jgi:hypothetical protein
LACVSSTRQNTNSAKHNGYNVGMFCLTMMIKALVNIAWDTFDKGLYLLPE